MVRPWPRVGASRAGIWHSRAAQSGAFVRSCLRGCWSQDPVVPTGCLCVEACSPCASRAGGVEWDLAVPASP